MKKCSKCKQMKYLADFSKNRTKPDGLRDACKRCDYERHNAWRLKNKEHVREYVKRWNAENPDKHYAYTKKWRNKVAET